jgi:hypothetical protein
MARPAAAAQPAPRSPRRRRRRCALCGARRPSGRPTPHPPTRPQALPPRPGVKLPSSIFWDFEADGAIFHIAKRCYQWRQQLNLKRIEWLHPGKRLDVSGAGRASFPACLLPPPPPLMPVPLRAPAGCCLGRGCALLPTLPRLAAPASPQNSNFLKILRGELEQKRLLRPTVVFIHPSCAADAPRLRQIVRRPPPAACSELPAARPLQGSCGRRRSKGRP